MVLIELTPDLLRRRTISFLQAFGGDSLVELISGLAVLTGLRKESSNSVGRDVKHGKRTERFTSALLFALIPIIGLGSILSYVTGLKLEGSPQGIVGAIGAVIVMPYLYVQKKRIGKETRSLSLSMDAIESVTCLFMAVALLGGLIAEYFLGIWWADYLATGIILSFVAKEALNHTTNFLKIKDSRRRRTAGTDF